MTPHPSLEILSHRANFYRGSMQDEHGSVLEIQFRTLVEAGFARTLRDVEHPSYGKEVGVEKLDLCLWLR